MAFPGREAGFPKEKEEGEGLPPSKGRQGRKRKRADPLFSQKGGIRPFFLPREAALETGQAV